MVARLVAKEGDYATVLLPSGEMRLVPLDCRATVGKVGNLDHQNITHRQGRPPPPHGHPPVQPRLGAEPGRPPDGRRRRPPAGGRHPVSPWGKFAKGGKTRRKKAAPTGSSSAAGRRRGEPMGRSIKKGPFVDAKLLRKVQKRQGARQARSRSRRGRARCTITPDFVGQTFMVHNGKVHLKVFVTEDMVGHKLGEFAPTRQFRGHGQEKKETAGAAPRRRQPADSRREDVPRPSAVRPDRVAQGAADRRSRPRPERQRRARATPLHQPALRSRCSPG